MMDFTDITTAVKKTTKKAADFAMKPVNFVTAPVIEANNKLKKSVFGPDMAMLDTLRAQQQDKLLHSNYFAHLEKVEKHLKTKKLAAKKLSAYLQACKLIEAAPASTCTLEQKIEQMQDLFDDLRTTCKQGMPTKLKDNVFSFDKKSTYTTDEFTTISEQIAASKKYLNTLLSNLIYDLVPLYLTKAPDPTAMLHTVKEKRTHLDDEHKAYQDGLFAYNDTIGAGRKIINEIVDGCDRLRKYHTNQESMFSTEKSKYKQVIEAETKKLQTLVSKDFVAWQKKVSKAGTETTKLHADQQKILPALTEEWKKFFTTWQTRERNMQSTTTTTKKNYHKLLTTTQKTLQTAQKTLQETHTKTIKLITEPYDQTETFTKQLETVTTQHTSVHDTYLALATHQRTTGVQGELPLCGDVWLVDQRVDYLREEMLVLRQHMLVMKLLKRVWNAMATTVKSFESRLDDRKIYAKAILEAPLKYLRTLTTHLQEQVKSIETELKSQQEQLTKDKEELWDSISFKRLVDTKRTRYQDTLWATVGASHSSALNSEIKTQTERKKALDNLSKTLEKKHNIDNTALDEQQKTVTLLKSKEQKTKLAHLEATVKAQSTLQTALQKEKEVAEIHRDETVHLQKKYEFFGKNHQEHGQRYKKFIDQTSKKLSKSPLNQWVDCSNKVTSMFA